MTDETKWQLRKQEADDTAEAKSIHAALAQEIEAEVGPAGRKPLCLSFHDAGGALRAGLRGYSHWQWLYISHLWVDAGVRTEGLGTRLIEAACREATTRGLVGLYVDTFSVKAARFYEKNGFREVGRIANFPPGRERIFLSRALSLVIRLATESDVEAITQLVNSAYRGETGLKAWTTEASFIAGQRIDQKGVSEILSRPQSHILVATRTSASQGASATLLGCVHIEAKVEETYLGMLTVSVDQQREGVGAQLLAAAEAMARERFGPSGKHMVMTVISRRTELIHWYEKRGYTSTGETQPFPYGDERFGRPLVEGLEFLVLRKELRKP
jgi:ribosomal protein S18 acetylase RimI-like enzyme